MRAFSTQTSKMYSSILLWAVKCHYRTFLGVANLALYVGGLVVKLVQAGKNTIRISSIDISEEYTDYLLR